MTDLGKEVLTYLIKNFSNIINIEFTSSVESDLDKIAEGSLNWIEVIRKVYDSFSKDVEIQMKNPKVKGLLQNKVKDIQLGEYKGSEVIIKDGKYGPYLSYNGKNISLKYLLQNKKKEKQSLKINDLKELIDYPMKLGKYDKKEVCIHIGPYGKYMKYNGKNYKIQQKENYELEDCIRLLE
tara:strand:- start:174 stop:716 length:543 start_codon:yes stop_codon:yes gene_type:complete